MREPGETPEEVLHYRSIKRTLTHQVGWSKIESLRSGNLFMTLPNNDHFAYVKKFLQPMLFEPTPGIIGIVSLSCVLHRGERTFRIVTYWPIKKVKLSANEEDWLFALDGEIK